MDNIKRLIETEIDTLTQRMQEIEEWCRDNNRDLRHSDWGKVNLNRAKLIRALWELS